MTPHADDPDAGVATQPSGSKAFVAEMVVATLLIAFSSALLIQIPATGLSIWVEGRGPGSAFLALIFATGLLMLGIVNLLAAVRARRAHVAPNADAVDQPATQGSRTRLWLLIGIIVLAPILMGTVGAVPTIVVVVLALQLLIERMKWWTSLIIAVVTATAVYFLFEVALGLRLPAGLFT